MSEGCAGDSRGELTVLYGSHTGCAVEVGKRVRREGRLRRYDVTLSSLNDTTMPLLSRSPFVVFVVSTTGQGDVPESMKAFWRSILRKGIPPDALRNVQLAVIGLGDSSYNKYNFIAKKLYRRLLQLGGRPLIELCLCDDQHELGIDGSLMTWLPTLWENSSLVFPLPAGVTEFPPEHLLPSEFEVSVVSPKEVSADSREACSDGFSASESHLPNSETENAGDADLLRPSRTIATFPAHIVSNTRVTATDHWQDVRLVTIELPHTAHVLRYCPGDVLNLYPKNSSDVVLGFFGLTGLNPEECISLSSTYKGSSGTILSRPFTWREAAESYFDLNGVPGRDLFSMLAIFSQDEAEKEKLEELSSTDGQEDLFNYCNRMRRTYVEVLTDFPHTTPNIPPAYYFDIIPPMRHRSFSIASAAPQTGPLVVSLLVAVVTYKTRIHTPRKGTCSHYLASLTPLSGFFQVWITGGTIKFPTDSHPLIMVGPGTGLAPFRSVLQTRRANNFKENVLFFGCRNSSKDWLCQVEMEEMCSEGTLKLFTAFSRDQDEKMYVQHRILEQKSDVWSAINDSKACFYVAGNAKYMPEAVREAVQKVAALCGKLSEPEALAYVSQMEREGRYQVECWA